MSDASELRRLAEAATPGPWVTQEPGPNDPGAGTIYIDTHAYEDGPEPVVVPGLPLAREDAAYIAAANPSVILRLLDELEELRQPRWSLEAYQDGKRAIRAAELERRPDQGEGK